MPGVGSKIVANDYNTIQSTIAGVLGQNSAGYGQAINSSQVSSNAKITAAQWNALQTDISVVNYHQLNASPAYNGSGLTTATTNIKIKESDRAAYLAVAQALASSSSSSVGGVTYPSCYVQAPAGQFTTPVSGVFPSVATISPGWNSIVNNTITVSFSSNLAAEYYFNSGSRFNITASATGGQTGVVGTKDYSWATLLSNMGTISLGYSSTTKTGSSGTASGYGWTYFNANKGVNQTIYTNAISGTYAPNQYDIVCSLDSSGTVLTFTIQFQDLSGQPNPPWGTDENITATISSQINAIYSSGPVSVAAYLPTPSNTYTTSSSSYTPPPPPYSPPPPAPPPPAPSISINYVAGSPVTGSTGGSIFIDYTPTNAVTGQWFDTGSIGTFDATQISGFYVNVAAGRAPGSYSVLLTVIASGGATASTTASYTVV